MGDESSVRVAVRIRPQIARELIDLCRICTSVTPGEPQVWLGSDKAFTYDHVYDTESFQSEVYEGCVQHLVEGCFEGYNATVLAYGQTGSGKTYTMGTGLDVETNTETLGIIPRAVHHLFEGIESRRSKCREEGVLPPEFKVTVHFMELYNEDIIDLFDAGSLGKSSIRIHESGDGGIYVSGITTRNVKTVEETLNCLRSGALSRTTGSTNMNAQSSRSHAIFTLLIQQQRRASEESGNVDASGNPEYEILTSKFHFVDLAGSERLKRTGATGDRAREGISINCGLLALGNVISALGDVTKRASHVPYRDSKLTRLLQDSLGGNSQTLMIACVSPSDRDFMETLNTLKYANRARNIRNKVTVNQDKTSRTISLLRGEIQELQIELMEYRQGKRMISADGVEGVNDMFHENQMLSTEAANLRTRVKALQETIEMLTMKNTQLLSEKAMGEWGSGEGGDSDMTSVVQGYIKEIEELRSKLCESENMCQQLRKNVASRAGYRSSLSPLTAVSMTGSMMMAEDDVGQSMSELLEEAKRDLTKEMEEVSRKTKEIDDNNQNGNENEEENEDEEDSSDESGDDKENFNEEIADLTSEISIKQKLIESLELTQRRLETMKHQYEEKLNMLMNRIKATQDERDKVLSTLKSGGGGGGGDDRMIQVKQEYQKKLQNMELELKKLKTAQKEHAKLMRERTQHERQLRTLKMDLGEMKKTKVKLMNKMKEESQRAKREDQRNRKEISQLRKEQRKKENKIRSLEADNRLKNIVLKRRSEELTNLKKVPKNNLSQMAAGRYRKKLARDGSAASFSPKVAKHRWQGLEQTINKVAYNKQTISSLERDMDRWLKERESLSRQLDKAIRKQERLNPRDISGRNDTNDQIDALRANIDYIYENITECQDNIMTMEESKGSTELDPMTVSTGMSLEELQYLVSKLVSMSINQATIAAEKQAMIGDLEGKMKQMEQTTSVQEQLLAHVLQDNDMNVYHLMSSLVAGDDNTPGSSESSRSNSPTEGRMLDKARQKTATTEDMLFSLNNRHVLSASTTALPTGNANATASAMDGLKASLAVGPSLSAPPTLDPRMTTSLEAPFRPVQPESQLQELPQDSLSSSISLRGIHRVTSAPNQLRDPTTDVTPPSSPIPYRKAISKDDNVFSRLTNATSAVRESNPNTGTINPHAGRIHHRSVLACTHVAQGHSKAVLDVFATDDKIFSASKDRTVKVWDLVRGEEVISLGGHPNNVDCVRYNEETRMCFTVSASSIKVWDLRENPSKCIQTLTSSGITNAGPMSKQTQSRSHLLPSGESRINDVAFSQETNALYSAAGNIVRIWDLRKYLSIGKLAGSHQAAVMCLTADSSVPNQDVVVTGSKDHYIKVFDVGTNRSGLISPRTTLEPPHYDGIQSLALYGNTLFSGSRDMCIKKWDLRRGEHVQSMNNAHKDWVCALCYLPGGQIVLSGCRGGVLKMWSAETCHLIGELRAHAEPINAITTNSTCIFTASNDCSIGLWRMRTSYDVSPELSDAA